MNEREQDILYEIRNMYVSGSGIILPRERLGIVVGYMVELEMRISDLTAERDAARQELANLRAACSRKEDVYPTETVIIRSASDLLVEFSQFAFFLGDIRKSKEASYRAQYILAALGTESEASE